MNVTNDLSLYRSTFKGLQICPFNKTHLIARHKMPIHMLKCEKHYSGPPLVTCRYNMTHMMPKEEMEEHLMTCPDHKKNYRRQEEDEN